MNASILLVAPEPVASTLAGSLRSELGFHVTLGRHERNGYHGLRREEFSLILLDENLAIAEPEATDALYSGAGTAPVLEANLGICGTGRVLRLVRSALHRRALDEAKARAAAVAALRNEWNASLTGLLLESQLALRGAGPELLPSLQHLIDLASELRSELRA